MQIRLQSCTYEPGENSMCIHVYKIIFVGQLYGAISKRAMAHSKRDEFNQRNRACIIRSSLQFGVQLEAEFSATSLLLSALLLLAHCAHCTLRPTVVLPPTRTRMARYSATGTKASSLQTHIGRLSTPHGAGP